MSGEASPGPAVNCGGLGVRAQLALMLLFAVVMGVQVGLMASVASDEATQANAIGEATSVFCLVDSAIYISASGEPTHIIGNSGAFSTAMTAALAKGCTAYGSVIRGPGVGGPPNSALNALQGMLCPSATMVDSSGRCKTA
eukprot:COSAG06_NODE_45_length_29559_cov_23.840835_20_plen_141_part_00